MCLNFGWQSEVENSRRVEDGALGPHAPSMRFNDRALMESPRPVPEAFCKEGIEISHDCCPGKPTRYRSLH